MRGGGYPQPPSDLLPSDTRDCYKCQHLYDKKFTDSYICLETPKATPRRSHALCHMFGAKPYLAPGEAQLSPSSN